MYFLSAHAMTYELVLSSLIVTSFGIVCVSRQTWNWKSFTQAGVSYIEYSYLPGTLLVHAPVSLWLQPHTFRTTCYQTLYSGYISYHSYSVGVSEGNWFYVEIKLWKNKEMSFVLKERERGIQWCCEETGKISAIHADTKWCTVCDKTEWTSHMRQCVYPKRVVSHANAL